MSPLFYAGGTYSASHINRIRSGAFVTAGISTSAASFTGDNGRNGTGTVIILQNQSTLITDVPKPVLDPSERDQILADAADAKAGALAYRAETAQAVSGEQEAIRDERQDAEDEKAEVRSEITQATDLIMLLADAVVAGATTVVNASLAKTRKASDQQMLATEDQYNKLRAEIVSLRNQMRFAALTSQTAAVGSLELAKFLLTNVGDPAVARKQTAIQTNAGKQIAEFKVMFDARVQAVAQAMFGAAWREHLDADFFDNDGFWHAVWKNGWAPLLVGANAVGNAAIDTGWGFVTLGYGEPWNVFDTSGEGYAESYLLARIGFEVIAGAGLGSAAGAPGKLGKAALIWDVAGNGSSVGRGISGVVQDGELNFQNGVQIFGGGFGLVGNFGGAFSKAAGTADDLADGTKGVDDIVETVASGPTIVLGFDRHLDQFAALHKGKKISQLAEDPDLWQDTFLIVMRDPNAIVKFNLTEDVDVWAGVSRASSGVGFGPTDWELLQIFKNREWWGKIKWFDRLGNEVPNPFE